MLKNRPAPRGLQNTETRNPSLKATLDKAKIREERKKRSFDYLRRALTSYRKKPEKYDE